MILLHILFNIFFIVNYIYALQLSLYAYIMECWGYELVDKGLEKSIHIRPSAEPKLIRIPYLKTK